ncbi:alkaline phosphatase D family protein [Flammeovirga aprica]|uniref:Alkaline phosphatase D family protein n=1 Tax=Flammeovirga aprica JL-4 TaxID=694437 RepID=A0A7X9RT66_9BACT|nr:alkaline phosphatase D family protein [Flammeovirga aprica]NME66904.1 alkaline phosphatase D family protein [Flammeovirga aprica JL-4]
MKKNVMNAVSRRKFIRNSIIVASGTTLLPLSACTNDDLLEEIDPNITPEGEFGFFEGVASFDPTQSQVILWTRYTPATNEQTNEIKLEVATDKDFNSIIANENVTIDTASDYTVNVDVGGLQSNKTYYYRFSSTFTGKVSPIGMTKTLPATGEVSDVKMAVVSCANYQAGLFNVYGAVALSEADVVVHLGDYIYEYGADGYGVNEQTASLDRFHKPDGEILSIEDYRTRYRQYRQDTQLQQLHQSKPFICVWDDHEITNDAYKDGAENHNEGEGDYETRKAYALQVWHEYLPARVSDNAKIYRSFDFGGIVDLHMLDTRIIGREKQLDYSDYFTATGLDSVKFLADWGNLNRTLLGTEQRGWLAGQLASGTAKWQVLGSQVLMGTYTIPIELLQIVAAIAASGSASMELLLQYQKSVTELLTIKERIALGDPTVTAEETARLKTVLPYNLDAWDGYPAEREIIYGAAEGKNLISLAGDTHNAWNSNLINASGNTVGEEFATASVSSPGFEGIFGSDPSVIVPFEQANVALIEGLKYADASRRGFVFATFSNASANAEWHFVNGVFSEDTTTTVAHSSTFS